MTLHLSDVVDGHELDAEIEAGYVNRRTHPEYPYSILNYSEKAQFENRWTDTIRNCRGLIYNHETFEVIARGMPKFFNHNQPGAPEIALDEMVHVADKADGSLGILYPTPDGQWAIATRGSFTSDQALHATEVFRRTARYLPADGGEGESWLFEVVYPENRIVLNYGDKDTLFFLGSTDIETGRFYPVSDDEEDEGWDIAKSFGTMTFGEALAMPPRKNAEGLVIQRVSDGAMVKVKQEDYLRLHKAIFGLSARKLWELLVFDADMDEYIASLPDELQPWATETARSIEVLAEVKNDSLVDEFMLLMDHLDQEYGVDNYDRGEFAAKAKESDDAWAMFALFDGKDIYPMVLKRGKPEAFITPVVAHGEDIA